MIQSSTSSSSNLARGLAALVVGGVLGMGAVWAATAQIEREPMTLRVVAVNPSAEKAKTVPVRIDLPQEVRPSDILDHDEALTVEYDTERSLYFVHNPEVALAPKQTKVFEVVVRDVWYVPQAELDGLHSHMELLLSRLEKSEYYDAAKQLGDSILLRLQDIEQGQADETIGRKQRIGMYRRNLLAIEEIQQDLARLEKLLSFTGGTPVPEMLEESPLKSDAPSTTTTWLVIFLILIFMGLLAGQFFFTWQRKMKQTAEFTGQQEAFPAPEAGGEPKTGAGDGE